MDEFFRINIPTNVGAIEKTRDIKSNKYLYFVQEYYGQPDADHNSYEIAKILFSSKNVRHFFVEGVFDSMSAQYIRQVGSHLFKDPIQEGLITAKLKPVECLALTSDNNFDILPADNEKLYNQNFGAYSASEDIRHEVLKILQFIHQILKQYRSNLISYEMESVYIKARNELAVDLTVNRMNIAKKILPYIKERQNDIGQLYIVNNAINKYETIINNSVIFTSEGKVEGARKIGTSQEINNEFRQLVNKLSNILDTEDPSEDLFESILTYKISNEKIAPNDILYLTYDEMEKIFHQGRKFLKDQLVFADLHLSDKSNDASYRLFKHVQTFVDLCRTLKIDLKDFPLIRYTFWKKYQDGTRARRNVLSFNEIIKETCEMILKSDISAPWLWKMLKIERDLTTVGKILKLQLSPAELKYVEKIRNSYQLEQVINRISVFGFSNDQKKVLKQNEDIWNIGIDRAIRYYDYARQRQIFMVNKIKEFFLNTDYKVAAIFLSNFNSDDLQRDLCRQNVCNSSMIDVKFNYNPEQEIYRQIMLKQRK